MMKSKIHRIAVTATRLHYPGSITIDAVLMKEADILAFERVQVVNIDNGARFETYAIEGDPNSGALEMNGAAARLAEVGDTVIVISYGVYDHHELGHYRPVVVNAAPDASLTGGVWHHPGSQPDSS